MPEHFGGKEKKGKKWKAPMKVSEKTLPSGLIVTTYQQKLVQIPVTVAKPTIKQKIKVHSFQVKRKGTQKPML